jgi:predicted peptidase
VISTLVILNALLLGEGAFLGDSRDLACFFKSGEYRYTGGSYRNSPFQYHLFVPRGMEPGKQYPLLLWLHGLGEASTDPLASFRWLNLVIDDPAHIDHYRFFILVVQCPPDNPVWTRQIGGPASEWGNDMMTVAVSFLHDTMRKYPVDPNRVYLSGVSSGASGCWEMALRYPELFAAVAPFSSGGGDASRAERLKDIPIWAFHNLDDFMTPPDGDKAMVAAVNEVGGNACLTFPPSPGYKHDSWTAAFQKHNIMEWMLAQRRGSLCWRPPNCPPWKWRNVLAVPAGMLAIVWLAWRQEERRRQRIQRDLNQL